MKILSRNLTQSFSQQASKLILFGGQGSQQKGMFSALLPESRQLAYDLAKSISIDAEEVTNTDAKNQLNKTQVCQPLIVLSHYLHFRQKISSVLPTDYMVGHSVGQYSALVNSGALGIRDAIRLVQTRGRLMQAHTKTESGMLVVVAKKEDLPTITSLTQQFGLQIACLNSRSQTVVTGEKAKARLLQTELKAREILNTFLPVSAAFHCAALRPMIDQFRESLEAVHFSQPKCVVLRNVDAKPYRHKEDIVEGLLQQLHCPVRFEECILRVDKNVPYEQIGHKPVVTRFIKQIRSYMT